jgi:hypothetical protein
MGQTITMAAFRRTILAIAAVLTMAASMVALAGPAFAKVTCESECVGGTNAAGVDGADCYWGTTTPSGNENNRIHFRPDNRPDGGSVQQGAEHSLPSSSLNAAGEDPNFDPCKTTSTPSGNTNGTAHVRGQHQAALP